jgi:hypothetical protein
VYLAEYEQCAESYRHTYETIWLAGSFFIAMTVALLAYWGDNASSIPFLLWATLPLPILFWWQAIFRPMDRYGQERGARLAAIETTINQLLTLNMEHFIRFQKRTEQNLFSSLVTEPRVNYIIRALAIILLVAFIIIVVVGVVRLLLYGWN